MLTAASANGALPETLIEVCAHTLLAALIEVAMIIACSEDAGAAVKLGRTRVHETRMLLVRATE